MPDLLQVFSISQNLANNVVRVNRNLIRGFACACDVDFPDTTFGSLFGAQYGKLQTMFFSGHPLCAHYLGGDCPLSQLYEGEGVLR